MHAILATLGTDGDVLPYVALGRALRRRGHAATLVTSDKYAPLAADGGLDFVNLLDRAEFDRVLSDPDFWHPLKGAMVAARWGVDHFAEHYHLLHDLCRAGESDSRPLLIASPGILPARLLEEQRAVRLVSVVLQPWMIQSNIQPPIMPGGLSLPRGTPRPIGELYWRGIDLVGEFIIGRHLNRFRATLGMPPVARVFRWWLSPNRILGFYPHWYAGRPKDWPDHLWLAGFPRFDGLLDAADSMQTMMHDDSRPIAFTFGTGVSHAAELFAQCAAACEMLGRHGLFLTRHARQLPSPLPPFIRHVPFAPLGALLPRCAAIVHHGGIGTTAAALAAGVPQLVLPFAYDQFDNAAQVRRLGVGEWLPPRRRSAAHLAAALKRLECPAVAEHCKIAAQNLANDGDVLDVTAAWLEGVVA
jgi:UDP:flavonoid glycosyltransferase YjiC (YdhE family)